MKATKPFYGVRPGDVHPTEIAKGEEIPEPLIEAARALGCVAKPKPQNKAAAPTKVK